MTLYDLLTNITIQGNIRIVIFDPDENETDREYYTDTDQLSPGCIENEIILDYPVTYMYSQNGYLTIEVQEPD